MKVIRESDGTYAIADLSGDELATLAAVADFPLWSAQPPEVESMCAALYNGVCSVLGSDGATFADGVGMVPVTTVA